MSGTLYGVGLGPGDPGLITLKAARLIGGAAVIAYPALEDGDSLARAIAADLIPEGVREIALHIPFVVDREPAQVAYDRGADEIAAALQMGDDVVMLCEGDPLFYGSFMYVHARLSGQFDVQVVPGVTSVTACAALAGLPLAARNEVLTVLPGTLPDDALRSRLEMAQAAAIMKVGRHLGRIKAVIDALGLMERAVYVERASLPNQRVMPLSEVDEAPYFSMILLTRGNDPWL